jgi:hypothetical protein
VSVVTLVVNDGKVSSSSDTATITVVDTTPPTGDIVFPSQGQCLGPAALPVVVTDSFADLCDPAIVRTYDPAPGPDYSAHGDYHVVLTVQDSSGNTASVSRDFTIDTVPPTVQILQPLAGTYFVSKSLPMSVVFAASDDDGASGGAVHEVVKLQGCAIYDGLTYGDMDGLLSDEVIQLTQAELCRLAALCGFTELHGPELRVEASDCGGNMATASRAYWGAIKLFPGICGRALPRPTSPPRVQRATQSPAVRTTETRLAR